MPFLDSKDRPFGIAGQPVDGDLFSDRADIHPSADPTDPVTHPDIGYQYNMVGDQTSNVVPINTNILGQPGKWSARRLGYKTK